MGVVVQPQAAQGVLDGEDGDAYKDASGDSDLQLPSRQSREARLPRPHAHASSLVWSRLSSSFREYLFTSAKIQYILQFHNSRIDLFADIVVEEMPGIMIRF